MTTSELLATLRTLTEKAEALIKHESEEVSWTKTMYGEEGIKPDSVQKVLDDLEEAVERSKKLLTQSPQGDACH